MTDLRRRTRDLRLKTIDYSSQLRLQPRGFGLGAWVLVLSCFFIFAWFAGCSHSEKKENDEAENLPIKHQHIEGKSVYFCPICGLPSSKDRCMRRPLAVMIENHRKARPQSGLSRACLVYEAPAEGGITRFLAVFLHQDSKTIGPVRSARPYFIDWSLETNSVYVHCGQSWEAFEMINSLNFPTINEMWQPDSFWRSSRRGAPHNLYTNSDRLRKVIRRKQWEKSVFEPRFDFSEIAADETAAKPVKKILISYLPYDYKLVYRYDGKQKAYTRSMDGALHIDALTDKPLSVRNIIFQYVQTEIVDEAGRLNVQDIGEGVAQLVSGGRLVQGRWKKSGIYETTRYADLSGKSWTLLPGLTFIQIVPLETKIVFQ